MNGKIISSNPHENDVVYRVEIFEDEALTLLVGEANVFGSGSFSRERQYLNKTMIKRYAKSVANRRGVNFPWFISDELAQRYGISTELPVGISEEMKPLPSSSSKKHSKSYDNQAPIDNYFMNSSAGFLADERSASPPPPQFSFPCDDAVVPVEFIDPDLKYPELVPINQLISDSGELSRSLSIWAFCQTFSSQLKLSPFSYDDWEEALTCTKEIDSSSNPIIEETFLALLSTLMKDRRSLTKGAFADKLKSSVLTFKPEIAPLEVKEGGSVDNSTEEEGPEILISSGDDSSEDEGVFVKRSLKGSAQKSAKKPKSLLLPSIDLRKHRWYETRAMEYWHFVLGSFHLELIDMVAQFIAEEESKDSEESGSEEDTEEEEEIDPAGNDSAYEDDGSSSESEKDKSSSGDSEESVNTELKQLSAVESPLEVMKNFIKIYEPISEELTSKGSKEMFSTYLNLSLSSKLALLEFLVHNHHDRDAFKAFVEDCLERQGEARRLRKEIEIDSRQSVGEVERLEGEVLRLKDENLKITERLEADESDIEMSSSDEGSESSDDAGAKDTEDAKEAKDAEVTTTPTIPTTPLTEKERDEFLEKRTVNKKEITGLNAQLRKLRPEATALQRKSDAAHRDLRKSSSFRTFSLGQDRHSREYWWFGDFITPVPRLLIFDPVSQSWIGAIDNTIAFELLMEWLNPLGIREAKLKAAMMEIEEDIRSFLQERDLPMECNVDTATADAKNLATSSTANVNASDSEEVDFDAFRRGRGRPPKGSSPSNPPVPQKRSFQKYKNTMS